MDTSNIIQIILVCIIPFLANIIQEIFRWLSKIKRSQCCGGQVEFDANNRNNSNSNLNNPNSNKV